MVVRPGWHPTSSLEEVGGFLLSFCHFLLTYLILAFDRVNHKIFLAKLRSFGIRGSFPDQELYLTERTQYVEVLGGKSASTYPRVALREMYGSILP